MRDINAAFKELGKLCAMHMPNTEEKNLTKLGTLLKAVDLIPLLEEKVCPLFFACLFDFKNKNYNFLFKVREKNLDPRMACLKRSQQQQQAQQHPQHI